MAKNDKARRKVAEHVTSSVTGDDKVEVHLAAPVDLDTFLKTFSTPALRCRSHADCVLVRFKNVVRR